MDPIYTHQLLKVEEDKKNGLELWSIRRTQSTTARFENGGKGPWAKECGQLRIWRRQGKRFSPRTSRKEHSPDNGFSPVRPVSASWLTELYHDTLVLFEATKFVVVSYGSHGKLIYLNKKSKRILQTEHSCISFLKGLKSDTANHLLNLVTLSLECSQNSILLLFTCLIFHPHWMVSSLRASSYRPQCQALYIL